MLEFVRVSRPTNLSEEDVVTLADAARLSSRSLAVIGAMLDRGSLPWYEYPSGVPGKSGARFTSRSAVLSLPAEKRTRPSPTARKTRTPKA